jgi:threonine dehydrogenase-like Zn-dependent dehydrogenase
VRAVVLRGTRAVEVTDVPDATLRDDRAAVVRTTTAAICGSDLHPYHGVYRTPDYVLGHEAVGLVAQVGREVTRFAVGDRVMLPSNIGCGACDRCRQGLVIHCRRMGKSVYGLNQPGLDGCQAEAVAVPLADFNLWPLPDDLSDEVGLQLTDNLPTAWYCARRARVQPGDVVAVLGLGPVGLLCVLSAYVMGAARVIAVDPVAERTKLAASFGAEAVHPHDAVAFCAQATQGGGVDVVLDAMGSDETMALGLEVVASPGRLCQVGVNEKTVVAFPWRLAFERAIEYHTGAVSVPHELPALLRLVRAGRIEPGRLELLFTHHYELADAAEAYRQLDGRRAGVIKVALTP